MLSLYQPPSPLPALSNQIDLLAHVLFVAARGATGTIVH